MGLGSEIYSFHAAGLFWIGKSNITIEVFVEKIRGSFLKAHCQPDGHPGNIVSESITSNEARPCNDNVVSAGVKL